MYAVSGRLSNMLDYPVDIFSYDFLADGVPSPELVAQSTGKFVMGGIVPISSRTTFIVP
jgi:hypothetical protein